MCLKRTTEQKRKLLETIWAENITDSRKICITGLLFKLVLDWCCVNRLISRKTDVLWWKCFWPVTHTDSCDFSQPEKLRESVSALERFLLFTVVKKPWKHWIKVSRYWKAYKRNILTQIPCLFLASLITFPHTRLALLFFNHVMGTAWCKVMQNSLLHQPHLCSMGGTGLQFLLLFDVLVDGEKKNPSKSMHCSR